MAFTFISKQLRKPSKIFGRFFLAGMLDKANANLHAFMKELLAVQKKDRLLEIGFGTGRILRDVALLAGEGVVEGIDFSEGMVTKAKKVNKQLIAAGRVVIQQGNLERMPYDDACFDKVYTANTLYFWPEPLENALEIMRVLKPGGVFVMGFRDRSQMEKQPVDLNVFTLYSQGEVRELLLKAGFEKADILAKPGGAFESYCAVAVKRG